MSATNGASGDQAGNRVTAPRLDDSSAPVSHNDATATALGNDGAATMTVAVNRIAGAAVAGATYRGLAGPIGGSVVSLSGHRIAAAATGNFATGAITAP